jgi:hypothetical protein
MKFHLYLIPLVLTISCTDGKKFKGAAATATSEVPAETPSQDEVPSTEPVTVSADPIIAVTKMGINFEDQVPGDQDFNDAVLCFEGGFDFAPDAKTITSSKDQTVIATASKKGNCDHEVVAEILDSSGKLRSSKKYLSNSTTEVELVFKKGDRLEVYMTPVNDAKSQACNPQLKRDMHNPVYALLKTNVCNTSGN